MGLFKRKQDKWLLVFTGCILDEVETVKRCLVKASEVVHRSIPIYEIKCIEREKTKKIASAPGYTSEEISELFSEVILNDVIKWKGECEATQVAIILPSKAFTCEDTFVHILTDFIFKEPNYHAVCYTEFFLDTGVRETCKGMPCSQCSKLTRGCTHSCLLWLIWMMFGRKDDQIFNLLDSWCPE